MTPYWTDDARSLFCGDAWELAPTLAPESVDCIVTSPPYWGLRDYGADGQFGLEPHPSAYIDRLVALFRLLRPALKRTGSLWLNLGDSYFGGPPVQNQERDGFRKGRTPKPRPEMSYGSDGTSWLRPKQLLLIPSRVAIALQDDGWLLRNDVVWAKPNPMPSSVKDRLSCTWEHLFLFTREGGPCYWYHRDTREAVERQPDPEWRWQHKDTGAEVADQPEGWSLKAERADETPWRRVNLWESQGYWFDLEAIRAPNDPNHWRQTHPSREGQACPKYLAAGKGPTRRNDTEKGTFNNPSGRNPGDVWRLATEAFPEAHFATYPTKLVERCLLAGCAKEVCCECGRGKVREVIASGGTVGTSWHDHSRDAEAGMHQTRKALNRVKDGNGKLYERCDLGFRPTCACDAAFQLGLVLDPFAGAGTTLLVAKRLGLRGIGLELNADYCAMAGERIEKDKREEYHEVEKAGQLSMFGGPP